MTEQARNVALLLAGIAFVIFILFKRGLPIAPRSGAAREARQRITEAKRRASDPAATRSERATAMREAATIALDGLRHPGLAAAYARRAERLDPDSVEAVGLLATALRRAARYRALERMLWRKVGEGPPSGASTHASLQELISLYSGPLHRPEIAEGLKRMRLPPRTKEAG